VLCSVVKHSGSGTAIEKWGKTLDYVSCFPLHFRFYRFLSALQHNKAQSRLLYLFYDKETNIVTTHSAQFSNQTFSSKVAEVASAVITIFVRIARII